ncbi:hypothetical protein ACS72_00115 [Acinetobacter sp. VT 511]|nr:hypothetical protein ACS72_00115 [Acinetobacter sp. VT 511]
MIATEIVVVATHNLALGVLTGVLLAALLLANKLENDIQVENLNLRRRFLQKRKRKRRII